MSEATSCAVELPGVSVRPSKAAQPAASIAAGWAFYDLQWKKIAPKAFIFGVTNPVMVQGAIFAGITITEGWTPHPREIVATGDLVRVDPMGRWIEVLRRKA